jgi:5-hydroxyisourate hydrolase / 2-oxo-4-hydroxy-4-carboxy-5-ureidoimidazoline decarboxylase
VLSLPKHQNKTTMYTLTSFNNLSRTEATQLLSQCCGSTNWVQQLMSHFPFPNENTLLQKATTIWYEHCGEKDYMEAFSHHPKIGDLNSLAEKFPDTGDWAAGEQSSVQNAHKETLQQLADCNEKYFQQFGYIFIVCATGKPADEMLRLLEARLLHDQAEELRIAMGEQIKITLIRLHKLLDLSKNSLPTNSQITTHVLDTSAGRPGQNICIRLKQMINNNWETMALGFTNSDGRIPDLLPPGRLLAPGHYLLHFDTATYFGQQKMKTFYPEVVIHFTTFDDGHYHVPLLLNPFGYATYRGS